MESPTSDAHGSDMKPHVYKPLGKDDRIRLVKLLPGTEHDTIAIELSEHEFYEFNHPSYEALSYVWGSQDDSQSIVVDESSTITVTKNLLIALRHLRSEERPRVLWIDALAMNQADAQEKSSQIDVMARIFWSASRVIAWLGPESGNSCKAMGVLADIGSQVAPDWEQEKLIPMPGCRVPNLANPAEELVMTKEIVVALAQLISRP